MAWLRKTIVALLLATAFRAGADSGSTLRSPLAGAWYPADGDALRRQIKDFIDNVPATPPPADIIGLILPHAGYRFSGQTAAYGIKPVIGKSYSRVIIIAPSHHAALGNYVVIPDFSRYLTPLGEVRVDTAAVGKLAEYPFTLSRRQLNQVEHSVQIMLPLLQYALSGFKVVPLLVGEMDAAGLEQAARAIEPLLDADTLVVASSDFIHYGPRFRYKPFGRRAQAGEKIRATDMRAFDLIKTLDHEGLKAMVDETGATICGVNAIRLLLRLLPQDAGIELLDYTTSVEVAGPASDSVSYLAAGITGKWPAAVALTESDKKQLLKLARSVIGHRLRFNKNPTVEELDFELTPGMRRQMGAFVSLYKQGRLRGCIGEIIARRPLYQAVIEQAGNAAFRDPRFPPLKSEELDRTDIEISALLPTEPVESWKDIVVGRDGIILEHESGRSSVFLPHVAVEQGWNLEETLRNLAMKVGLPPEAWRQSRFKVFQAVVFGEKNSSQTQVTGN